MLSEKFSRQEVERVLCEVADAVGQCELALLDETDFVAALSLVDQLRQLEQVQAAARRGLVIWSAERVAEHMNGD